MIEGAVTDQQIVAIAITVLAILGGTLINNSRVGDVNHRIADLNSSLTQKIVDTRDLLRAEMQALEVRMDSRFNSIERKLDEILRIVGEHETRLTALERAR